MSKFKRFLIIYMLILTILMVVFLTYVVKSLKKYEELKVENYLDSVMLSLAKAGEKGQLSKYVDLSKVTFSKYENQNIKKDEAISELLKNSKLTYKLNKDSIDLNNPVYDVYANDNVLLNVDLNGESKVTKLGILTFQDWKLRKISLADKVGSNGYTIEVPSNLKIFVNDIELTKDDSSDFKIDEELKQLSTYADIPYMIKYNISNLFKEPKIKILDENGNEVKYEKEDNTYKINLNYEHIENAEEAMKKIKGNIDVMQVAKDWSLYLTNDLKGNLHGFYNINKYLIKDSYMWKYAYKWATNVDITFISSHILDNPTFTNTKLSNFEIYSENAFSCNVYLEKNFMLNKRGNQKMKDTMSEKMYFAYYEGSWKLVSMKSESKK